MKKIIFISLLLFPVLLSAQLRNTDVYKLPEMGKENIRENINIPGFDGYEVLKCDFHIHTLFQMVRFGLMLGLMRRGNKGWTL